MERYFSVPCCVACRESLALNYVSFSLSFCSPSGDFCPEMQYFSKANFVHNNALFVVKTAFHNIELKCKKKWSEPPQVFVLPLWYFLLDVRLVTFFVFLVLLFNVILSCFSFFLSYFGFAFFFWPFFFAFFVLLIFLFFFRFGFFFSHLSCPL